MKQLTTFFYSFKRSLSDASYYNDVLKVPFSFSVKYLYVLLFFVTFVQTLSLAILAFSFMPKLPEYINQFKSTVRNAYPAELVVNIKDGKLSTNVEEPYYINIPQINKFLAEENFKHLIVIDTKAQIDQYPDYQSVVLLTQNAAVYPDRQRERLSTTKVTYFEKDAQPVTIDKTQYDKFTAELMPLADNVPGLLTGFIIATVIFWPFLGALLRLSWQMLYLLMITVIVYIVSNIFKLNVNYGKLYQLGMHGLTLPLVVTTLLSLANVGDKFPFLFTAGFLLWMSFILSKLKKEELVLKD